MNQQKIFKDTKTERLIIDSYRNNADLDQFECDYEMWTIRGSNIQMGYATHNAFRYFGKFPPPVAKRFISELHDPKQGPVIDPMCGSGTTVVEAKILGREAIGLDVNPLSVLISKVKTTNINDNKVVDEISRYEDWCKKYKSTKNKFDDLIPIDRYLEHWFYPTVQIQIATLRAFIETIDDQNIKDLFTVSLAGIVRHCSRASNNLGRMFIDPAIKPIEVKPLLIKRIYKILSGLDELPNQSKVTTLKHDCMQPFEIGEKTNLVICHPPYFNVYKFSSIFKYEMLWTGFVPKNVRKEEIREFFKIGNPQKVNSYVNDLILSVKNISELIKKNGWFVLMIGDTTIRDERINTTALFLKGLQSSYFNLSLKKFIIRVPKHTEASYAASQRRDGSQVGINLFDHIMIFQKK